MSFASRTHPVLWHDLNPIMKALDAINPVKVARPVLALVNKQQGHLGVMFVARGEQMHLPEPPPPIVFESQLDHMLYGGAAGGGMSASRYNPQPGPQKDLMDAPVDVKLYGGAPHGQKNWYNLDGSMTSRHPDMKG